MALVKQSFYARDALEVAYDLLGKVLRHDDVWLRISEVEAYRWPDDTANHCRAGRTARNAPMWGLAGHTYVYLCYGMHQMLNLVTGAEGEGAAVLIRACELVRGHNTVQSRRGGKEGPVLLTGPGKVGAALALDGSFNHHALYELGGLELHEGPAPVSVLTGPRVGIDYAALADRQAPWRLAIAGSLWVSVRGGLCEA
ncbi:MAG: DNA-3-methyladenine glycosylase [Deltaproteobacteria bacterium]|nr:DNA-3-methyladenine glycosylase [Deltaproteobacteria bacterium]